MLTKREDLEKMVKLDEPMRIVVAAAHDEHILKAIDKLFKKGLIVPILVGDRQKIIDICHRENIDMSKFNIIKEMDDISCVSTAVDIVREGGADILMKGFVQTKDLLQAVLDKERGLRTNKLVSHIGIFELPNYHKMIFLTDAAITIAPNLKQKADIIVNAVAVAHCVGIKMPKVAVLSATEMVNTDMSSSIEGAVLAKMAQRGQIKNCIIDGPLALDNAINLDAALNKHIQSNVAGDSDILLVPNIEAGNILFKSMIFLYNAKACSVLVGAKVPIVATSRAEDESSKYYSTLLALLLAKKMKEDK